MLMSRTFLVHAIPKAHEGLEVLYSQCAFSLPATFHGIEEISNSQRDLYRIREQAGKGTLEKNLENTMWKFQFCLT